MEDTAAGGAGPVLRGDGKEAHMTLGEHPDRVDPRYLLSLEHFRQTEFPIGRFRDLGHLV